VLRRTGRKRPDRRPQPDLAPFDAAHQHIPAAYKRAGIFAAWPMIKRLWGRHFHQVTMFKNADPIGQLEGLLLVMGYQDRRDPQLFLNLFQALPQLGPNLHVQRAEWFVE
jgi:hypothetical protein